MNPFLATDGYKTGHHLQYPKKTTLVYSNFTPRSNKYAPEGCDKVVSFGQQMVMHQIREMFDNDFFKQDKDSVISEIKKEYSMYLNTDYDVSHIAVLWDLGYLPIKVKSIPEGTLVPVGVPVLTVVNTHPEFYWVTNFLETLISNLLWKPMTSATIAHQYKRNLTHWALKTDETNTGFVDFQAHDFSMRGMDSVVATVSSGLGHACSFLGSDSLPVVHGARKYYGEEGFVIGSVNATEHSVICAGGSNEGDELKTFRHLMNQFPTGILSIVSDTWDLWKVLTEYLPTLKEEILARDGKIVIRPDSGDPVDIICGSTRPSNYLHETAHDVYYKGKYYTDKGGRREYRHAVKNVEDIKPHEKGVIELLWDVFGGTVNEQGYKVLNPHIGVIYGDSITIARAEEICTRLEAKGFASTNIVLGIGSYTYQYNTRDTFGFAMKATYVEVNGDGREIFKDPITDDGTKKSAKGLLMVGKNSKGDYELADQVSWEMEDMGYLQTIFVDGLLMNPTTLTEIRKTLSNEK